MVSERHYNQFFFFFFNDTATTEIYTLSLHDALPISIACSTEESRNWVSLRSMTTRACSRTVAVRVAESSDALAKSDRKSTRLNSSHGYISYAVFCLKKKTRKTKISISCESTTYDVHT